MQCVVGGFFFLSFEKEKRNLVRSGPCSVFVVWGLFAAGVDCRRAYVVMDDGYRKEKKKIILWSFGSPEM